MPWNKGSGAPSFAFFAKGGMPQPFTGSPFPQRLLNPPFAESAKDGAPDPSRQSKMLILCDRVLTQNSLAAEVRFFYRIRNFPVQRALFTISLYIAMNAGAPLLNRP